MMTMPHKGTHEQAFVVCLDVAQTAVERKQEPSILISLAYYESRFDPNAVSKRGAFGPLQVMRRFWTGHPVEAGLDAWEHWRGKALSDRQGLAHYNAGRNPGPKAFRFADRVLGLAEKIRGWAGVG